MTTKTKQDIKRIRVAKFISEIRKNRKDIVFEINDDGEQIARMKCESLFDWYFNKKIINKAQYDVASDYYFVWYHGVFAAHPKMIASYEMVTSGGCYNGLNYSDFQIMCREKYKKLNKVLEQESIKLLEAVCLGQKVTEVIPNPRYYANERLRRTLDLLAEFKGYK